MLEGGNNYVVQVTEICIPREDGKEVGGVNEQGSCWPSWSHWQYRDNFMMCPGKNKR